MVLIFFPFFLLFLSKNGKTFDVTKYLYRSIYTKTLYLVWFNTTICLNSLFYLSSRENRVKINGLLYYEKCDLTGTTKKEVKRDRIRGESEFSFHFSQGIVIRIKYFCQYSHMIDRIIHVWSHWNLITLLVYERTRHAVAQKFRRFTSHRLVACPFCPIFFNSGMPEADTHNYTQTTCSAAEFRNGFTTESHIDHRLRIKIPLCTCTAVFVWGRHFV